MMLASRGKPADIARLQKAGYLFTLKVDGVRCKATVTDGKVELVSRQGVTITSQFPEVVEALHKALPVGHWVLDGELAVNDERGLPSWPLTHRRNAQTRNTSGWAAKLPATYYLFDLLVEDGHDISSRTTLARHEGLAAIPLSNSLAVVLNSFDGAALWEVVMQHGLEGLVAKRANAPYRNGRGADWVKIKRTSTVTCLVGGFSPGTGSRASTFGHLDLYLVRDNALTLVGHVGSGFSDAELKQVMHALHRPPMIVEIEYLDVSPDGQLRQPVFLRMRTDVDITACTHDQLAY